MLSGGPMGGGPSLVMGSRGGHHHHGGYDSQGRGGGGQDYNSMGRGMIGDGRYVRVSFAVCINYVRVIIDSNP